MKLIRVLPVAMMALMLIGGLSTWRVKYPGPKFPNTYTVYWRGKKGVGRIIWVEDSSGSVVGGPVSIPRHEG